MKALWIVFLLSGCAGVAEGLRTAGATGSEDVYRTQNGLPQKEARKTDFICMTDCTKRYSRAYCEKECSY